MDGTLKEGGRRTRPGSRIASLFFPGNDGYKMKEVKYRMQESGRANSFARFMGMWGLKSPLRQDGWSLLRLSSILYLIFVILYLISAPALAADCDDVQVTVTIDEVLAVEYTGSSNITFNVTAEDLDNGSMTNHDWGDLNWWANTAPWAIWVMRTHWTPDDLGNYGSDGGVKLQVKLHDGGNPPGGPWYTVPDDDDPEWEGDNGRKWLTSAWYQEYWGESPIGSGTFPDLEWKLKHLDWSVPPGTYTGTVTFTISPV